MQEQTWGPALYSKRCIRGLCRSQQVAVWLLCIAVVAYEVVVLVVAVYVVAVVFTRHASEWLQHTRSRFDNTMPAHV